MKKVYFKTFGCRTNQFDTQVMMANLNDYLVTTNEDEADIIIINSCTVTNSADSSVRNYINKINKSDKKAILAGCGAISKGKELFEDKKIFGVIGHSNKENINNLLKHQMPFFEVGTLNHIDKTVVSEFIGKSRAFIKIQEGCDFECSYCIIPSVRGSARSQSFELIINQIKILADNGFSEFIFTGTNVGSFGKDINSTLAKLIKESSKIRGVKRIRIGSLEPIQVTSEFKELLSEEFLEKHLHIAIQHSSNRMLEIMNRRNRFESDLGLLSEISNRGFALGTDYIIGHPYESSEIWTEAIKNLKQLPLTHIHPFTYSKRDNTKSATMKDEINGKVAKERMNELKEIIESKNIEFKKGVKTSLKILVETKKDGFFSGFDEYFNKVLIKSEENLIGKWIEVEKFEIKDGEVYAKI